MLNFSQYLKEQALFLQKDMHERFLKWGSDNESRNYKLIQYYCDYLSIVCADEKLIKSILDLQWQVNESYNSFNAHVTNNLNKIIDELVTKSQTEHNDY